MEIRGNKAPFHIENRELEYEYGIWKQENLSDLNFTTNEIFVSIHHLIPECLISLKKIPNTSGCTFQRNRKNEIILVIIEPHACKAKHYIK